MRDQIVFTKISIFLKIKIHSQMKKTLNIKLNSCLIKSLKMKEFKEINLQNKFALLIQTRMKIIQESKKEWMR